MDLVHVRARAQIRESPRTDALDPQQLVDMREGARGDDARGQGWADARQTGELVDVGMVEIDGQLEARERIAGHATLRAGPQRIATTQPRAR